MSTAKNTLVTIVAVSKNSDGSYTIFDALDRAHEAETPAGIGKIVARLVDDPDLPRAHGNAHDANVGLVAEVAKRITGKFAPELAPLVTAFEPAAHAVATAVANRPPRQRRRSNKRGGVARP